MSDSDEESKGVIKCKVVFVGGVRKLGIINKFLSNKSSGIGRKTIFCPRENKSIEFNIFDTISQKDYESIARLPYENTDVFILVYNINNYNSFDELKNYWIKYVKENANKEFSKKK